MCPESIDPSFPIAAEVSKWMQETQALHDQLQQAMEQIRLQPGWTPEGEQLIERLLILLRQRRAQTPMPDMIRTWIRELMRD